MNHGLDALAPGEPHVAGDRHETAGTGINGINVEHFGRLLAVQPARFGAFGPPRLEITGLNAPDDGGQLALRNLSLTIHAGSRRYRWCLR